MFRLVPFLVMFWVLLYPRPYGIAISCAAIVPWLGIALAWMNPGRIRLDERKRFDQGDVLIYLLTMCPMALLLRASFDVKTVDTGWIALWGAVLGLPLWIAIVLAPVKRSWAAGKPWGQLLLLSLSTTAYGGALLALTNAMWDGAKPEIFTTVVAGKQINRGKGTTYSLTLAPWSQTIDETRIEVSRAYFGTVNKGDTVCVRVYPGTFHLRWMEVGGCEDWYYSSNRYRKQAD